MDKRRMNTDSSQTTKIRIRNSTQSILGGKYYPHTKIKDITKTENLRTTSSMNINAKNPEQNSTKLYLATFKKAYTTWPSEVYPRDGKWV